jgi:hypothetical protein
MNAGEFLSFYNSLPTRADQKELRDKIITKCKIKKSTFYSWLERGDVPDPKAMSIITELIREE